MTKDVVGAPTEPTNLLCQGVPALLRDVHEVEHAAVKVRQRRDGLHLDGVALLQRVVQQTRCVDDLRKAEGGWISDTGGSSSRAAAAAAAERAERAARETQSTSTSTSTSTSAAKQQQQ